MAKNPKTESPSDIRNPDSTTEVVNLSALLTKRAKFVRFSIWIVGDTPLITHAWSHKAKNEMLAKQVKAAKAGREQRNPESDFVNSLYEFGKDKNGHQYYGFPATGIKDAFLSGAHKDKGIPRTVAMGALWIDAQMVRSRPALSAAICDMPLLRIYGSDPQMREDMVKVGSGMNKTATLAYRGQFTVWAMKVTGRFNPEMLSDTQFAEMITSAGLSCGIGEWRNARKGMFGAFHMASHEEEMAWDAFAAGTGPMPIPESYQVSEAAE